MHDMEQRAGLAQASTVRELRSLYRAAEARAARLRFIVEIRALLDAAAFEDMAPEVLPRLAAFAGALQAALWVSASHGRQAIEVALGRATLDAEQAAAQIVLHSSKSGVQLRLAFGGSSAGRPIDPDDRQALEVVMGQIVDTVGIQRQAAERIDLLGDLERQRNELSAFVGRLIDAQEQERRRVAQDLHDGSAQVAAALGYRLQAIAARLGEADTLRADLDELAALARQSVTEIRAAIADLRPPELDDLGLIAALRARLDAVEGLEVVTDLDEAAGHWPAAMGIVFYRVAQEAVTNVVKHAQASRIVVRVFEVDGWAYLEVIDNGKGIDGIGLPSQRGERLGIVGMRERLALLGGRLEIGPAASGGTRLYARAPLIPETGS